ncbi:MAG: hypothetical protein ACI3YZ_07175 [Prevotella sp.]
MFRESFKYLFVLLTAFVSHPASSQVDTLHTRIIPHLDVSVTAGSTGIGFELSMPIGNLLSVRTGYQIMPKFNYDMNFEVQVGDTPESKYDEFGNRVQTKFDKLAEKMKDFTGIVVDDNVRMIGEPTFHNWHLIVDVRPFNNKNWHFSTGFYLGPSKIAKSYNATEEMPSLLAMNIYNNIFDKVYNREPIFNDTYLSPYEGIGAMLMNFGRMGIYVGDYKYEYKTNKQGEFLTDNNGNMIHKPYYITPDADGMVKATMKTNSFKPYLGFGYGGRLLKDNDDYYVSFDCGVMFWGGKPKVVMHDGVDLTHDIINHIGQVSDYINIINKFVVFPVINAKFTRRINW